MFFLDSSVVPPMNMLMLFKVQEKAPKDDGSMDGWVHHLGFTAFVASQYPPWPVAFYLMIIAWSITILTGMYQYLNVECLSHVLFGDGLIPFPRGVQDDCVSENQMYGDMPWIEQDTENKTQNNVPVVHVRENYSFLLLLGFICWALVLVCLQYIRVL